MSKILILCAVFLVIQIADCLDPVAVNFMYKSDAVLDCSSAGWDEDKIEFYREIKDDEGNTKTEKVENFKNERNDKDMVLFEGSTMTLKDIRREQITSEYFCKSTESDDKLYFTKQIQPFLMFPERQSQTVTEGGIADFTCQILYGNDSEITWTWSRNGTDIIEDDNNNINSTQYSTTLVINGIQETHRGKVTCTATNKFGSHSSDFQLRVKTQLAALWPFLAIVAEVLILCVIILIYEKKCNKKTKNTGEDNEQTENLMGKDAHGDLKKRNPKA